MPQYELKLAHLCEVAAHVSAPIVIGPSSWGIRLILPVVGGTVDGPKLKGRITPPGGDWMLIRADNCLELDIRSVIETDDEAIIYTSYSGLVAMTQEQVDRMNAMQALHDYLQEQGLRDKVQDLYADALQGAVDAGVITQEQADQLLEAREAFGIRGFRGHPMPRFDRGAFGGRLNGQSFAPRGGSLTAPTAFRF